MVSALKLLVLEDRVEDVQLILHELRRAGYDPEWQQVETEADFIKALDQNPDLILADYNLPDFTGLKALQHVRARGMDTPFILISGMAGEEIAVEAIKLGACNYLIKDHLGRLGQAAQRALQEKHLRDEKRHSEETLNKFSSVIEQTDDTVVITDREGIIEFVNPAFEKLTGYSSQEALGKTPRILKSGVYDQSHYERLWKIILAGKVYRGEVINRKKNGELYYEEKTISPLRDAGGNITHFVATGKDVTDRKQDQAALQKWAHIFEHAEWGVVVSSSDGKTIEMMNPAFARMHGYEVDELIGKPVTFVFAPDTYEELQSQIKIALEKGHHIFESSHIHKDGTIFPVLVDITVVKDKTGNFQYRAVNVQNITEQKKIQEQVRQNAARARALAEISKSFADASLNDEAILEIASRRVCELIGDICVVTLFSEDRRWLVPVAAHHRDPQAEDMVNQLFGLTKYPADAGLVPQVVESGQTLFVPDMSPEVIRRSVRPEYIPYLERYGVSSLIIVPMRAQGQSFGTMGISRDKPGNPYTVEERNFLQSLADQTALAIANAHLYEDSQRRLAQTQVLRRIDMAIISSTDLGFTLRAVLEQVVDHMKVDAASILLLKPHTRMLEHAASLGFRSKGIEYSTLNLGHGYAGKIALERAPIHIPNIADYPASFLRTSLLSAEEFVGYYGVPLIARGQIKGVMELFHRSPLEPDKEWLDFLEAIAQQTSIAIDNATLFENLERSNLELMMSYDETIEGWSHALDLRDKETEGHTQRVTDMTVRFAKLMGLSDVEIMHTRRGALLHDIGKMGVPDAILLKPGPLTDEEWVIMRQHPVYAYDLLYAIKYLRPALDIPYCHHEKWDGSGYPRGLKGEQIPIAARLFAAVDIWDALTSDRPYRAAWSAEKTLEYIQSLSGSHLQAEVVEGFKKIVAGQ